MNLRYALLALVVAPALAYAAKPASAVDHWVATWATADFAAPVAGFKADAPYTPGARDTTLRQVVHTSLAGPLVRIEFSNAFGTEPLTIGAAHIALAGPVQGEISLPTANALTFNGLPSITIPAGGEAISDPAAMALPAEADLAISTFIPQQPVTVSTFHGSAFCSNFVAPGNVVGARALPTPTISTNWFFLKAVDVKTTADTGAIVAFGDSITDGYASTPNAHLRWSEQFAHRLQGDKHTRNLAVVNEGIGGNRVLQDGTGQNALARFDRDALSLSGVRYLIVLEAINDIGQAFNPANPQAVPIKAEDLIAGLAQLTERAHAHGITVIGATLTPYLGAGYSSPAGEQVRLAYNAWIRSSKLLDGFVDFDKATESSTSPGMFNPTADIGDHLHPNDAGFKAMAEAIDLKMFYGRK